MPEWLRNVWDVVGVAGTIVFALGVVVTAVRSHSPVRWIPSWWWIGDGVLLIIVIIVSRTTQGWLQGTCAAAGLLSIGIGLPILVTDVKAGYYRRQEEEEEERTSQWDHLAARDWQAGGGLVRVLQVQPYFHGLSEESPYIDFKLELLNTSVHQMEISPEVRGRIAVPDASSTFRDLHTSPELKEVEIRSGSSARSWLVSGPIRLERNKPLWLTVRQHVLPAVRDTLRAKSGESVPFDFKQVVLSVSLTTWDRDEFGGRSNPMSERIRLGQHQLEIPGGLSQC